MVSVTSSFFDAQLLAVRIVPSANPAYSTLPKHIGFLVDTSGSMSDYGRLTSVQRTLDLLIQAKPAAYRITIVQFASSAQLVADAEQDPAVLQPLVSSLVAEGGTNLEAGILLLRDAERRRPLDAVVLLTDGDVTSGSVTTTTGLRSLFQSSFPRKIPIHTIGCGEGYNRALLKSIAELTRSLHMYADVAEALPAVVGDILAGVQSEVGTAASLLIPPSYKCFESTDRGEYTIGTLIAEKEEWILLQATTTPAMAVPAMTTANELPTLILRYTGSDGDPVSHTIPITTDLRRIDIAVQRDRVLSTQAMKQIYEAIEGGRSDEALRICTTFLATLEASEATEESLVLCIKAQFAELIEQLNPTMRLFGTPSGQRAAMPPSPALLSRLASNTVALTTQRGFVSRMASGGSDTHSFSSPSQQAAQRSMTTSYAESP
jgi:hypothetical protein